MSVTDVIVRRRHEAQNRRSSPTGGRGLATERLRSTFGSAGLRRGAQEPRRGGPWPAGRLPQDVWWGAPPPPRPGSQRSARRRCCASGRVSALNADPSDMCDCAERLSGFVLALGVFIGIVLAMLEVTWFWSMPSRRASTHPLWKFAFRNSRESSTNPWSTCSVPPVTRCTFRVRTSLVIRVETETAHHPHNPAPVPFTPLSRRCGRPPRPTGDLA